MPILGAIGTLLFYFMDRYWYHRLLIGAVNQAAYIEDKYKGALPEIGLTRAIGSNSPIVLSRWITKAIALLTVARKKDRKDYRIHSTAKIEMFYKPIVYLFILIFLTSALFGGLRYEDATIVETLTAKFATKPPAP
ncbi:MAG TPA: hypothetical protein VJQ55_01490 [Candidatus Binatia bacterium]|nr:hypothetical protein [Candidatus Binatia bacterium]